MGLIISTVVIRFFRKKEINVLMVGLREAGKTSILYKLKLGETVKTYQSFGYQWEKLDYENVILVLWDLSAHHTRYWKDYYCIAQGLIFVVDSNNREAIKEAKMEFEFLAEADELRSVAVLILANKQDIPGAMGIVELIGELDLNHILCNHRWRIQSASVIQGIGLSEGVKWLYDKANRQ